jgi:hypothetical protein
MFTPKQNLHYIKSISIFRARVTYEYNMSAKSNPEQWLSKLERILDGIFYRPNICL